MVRPHKYIRRLGAPKQYHYIYREPLRDLKTVKEERDKFTVGSPEWKKLDAERIATRYLQKPKTSSQY